VEGARVVTTIRAFAGGFIEEYRGLGLDALLAMACWKRSSAGGTASWRPPGSWRTTFPCADGRDFGWQGLSHYRIYEKALKIQENL
jgi:hypothetical protein